SRAADSHETFLGIAINLNVCWQPPNSGRHSNKPENDHYHAFDKTSDLKDGQYEDNVFPGSNISRNVKVDEAGFQQEAHFKKAEADVLRDENREQSDRKIGNEGPIDVNPRSLRLMAACESTDHPRQIQSRQSQCCGGNTQPAQGAQRRMLLSIEPVGAELQWNVEDDDRKQDFLH